MCHRNALLMPTGRLRLAWCVVEDSRRLRRAAERFQVGHTTASTWWLQGWADMYDRSSRPPSLPAQDRNARAPWRDAFSGGANPAARSQP